MTVSEGKSRPRLPAVMSVVNATISRPIKWQHPKHSKISTAHLPTSCPLKEYSAKNSKKKKKKTPVIPVLVVC